MLVIEICMSRSRRPDLVLECPVKNPDIVDEDTRLLSQSRRVLVEEPRSWLLRTPDVMGSASFGTATGSAPSSDVSILFALMDCIYDPSTRFTTVLPFAASSSSSERANLVRLFAIGGFTKRSCSLLLSLDVGQFHLRAFTFREHLVYDGQTTYRFLHSYIYQNTLPQTRMPSQPTQANIDVPTGCIITCSGVAQYGCMTLPQEVHSK